MGAFYPSTCDIVESHIACSCDNELGRVSSAALIHKSFMQQLLNDPESETIWAAGITAGFIIVFPYTQGSFNGGEPIFGRGFATTEETLMAMKFQVDIVDPDYIGNDEFYNSVNGSRNFHIAFCTETIMMISDKACSIFAAAPIENDLKKEITFKLSAKWTFNKSPKQYSIPDNIFVCAPGVVYGASFDNSFDDSFDIP